MHNNEYLGNVIHRIQEELPNYPMIPVSAKTECEIQKLTKDNVIEYNPGDLVIHTDNVIEYNPGDLVIHTDCDKHVTYRPDIQKLQQILTK